MKRFAALGAELWAAQTAQRSQWGPVTSMLGPARQLWLDREARLLESVNRSRAMLEPLGEPLLQDMGLHRWLRKDREEAYSDWLAWTLDCLPDVASCLRLFGVEAPNTLGGAPFSTYRELPIRVQRNDGTAVKRRLDIVARCGEKVLLVVEAKVTDADSADTGKQKDYANWLEAERAEHKAAVLLACSGSRKVYEGDFHLWTWEDLAAELRKMIPVIQKRRGLPGGAMALAFVGAIERNLVGLPTNVLARARNGMPEETVERVVRYLDKTTEKKDGATQRD